MGGACLLLRRSALDQVGGFDGAYHMYVEETDLCYRLWRGGWTVRFTPLADVLHHGGRSTYQRIADQPRLYWTSVLTYYAKHKPAWQRWLLVVLIRLGYGARIWVWTLRSRLTDDASRRGHWASRAESARRLLADLGPPDRYRTS